MGTKSGGPKRRGVEIIDGQNEKKLNALSKRELSKARTAAKKADKERKKRDAERKHLEYEKEKAERERIAEEIRELAASKMIGEDRKEREEEFSNTIQKDQSSDQKDQVDEKSAYEMLQDMRWVYRKVKGRKKLSELIENDDKQFVFMVKELMKIESSLLNTRAKAKDEPNDKMVFVVLKGLEKPPVSEDDESPRLSGVLNPLEAPE